MKQTIPTKLVIVSAILFIPTVYVLHAVGVDAIVRTILKILFTNI